MTRLVDGFADIPYKERLKELKLKSLSDRCKHADMLQTYRIIHNTDKLEESVFFTKAQNARTRGNGQKLFKHQCNTNVRKNAFSQRVVDRWNDLPSEVVTAPSVNRFKSSLRKYWSNPECKSPINQTGNSDREDDQLA